MTEEYVEIFARDYNASGGVENDRQSEVALFDALIRAMHSQDPSVDSPFVQFALKCNHLMCRRRGKIQIAISRCDATGRILLQAPLLMLSPQLLQTMSSYAPNIIITGEDGVQFHCYLPFS